MVCPPFPGTRCEKVFVSSLKPRSNRWFPSAVAGTLVRRRQDRALVEKESHGWVDHRARSLQVETRFVRPV
ncbi:MAG: hypothetical protein D6788_03315 [Planctomycetota bacterium]|nr:MAG: hypothetical protein D6788_03315 [Planctomycetota bacterium]